MIVVGFETASHLGGVGLCGPEGRIAEVCFQSETGYGERLLPAFDRLLADAGLSMTAIEGLAVSIGPGSFTGLRIGLSTVKGLALATGKPVVGVPTLEALATVLPACRYPICALLDARMGEVYAALFEYRGDALIRLSEDRVQAPEALALEIDRPTIFVGDGWLRYEPIFRKMLGPLAISLPPPAGPSPVAVASLGRRRLVTGSRDPVDALAPRYIRLSEAERKRAAVEQAG